MKPTITIKSKFIKNFFHNPREFLKPLAIFILSAVFVYALAPVLVLAQAASPIEYLVKLKTANPGALKNLGFDVNHQFAFSNNPAFQNIYGFESVRTLTDLKSELSNFADYIQTDNNFSASQIYNSYPYVTTQSLTANDPGFTSNPLNIDREWAIPAAGFDAAWTKTTGSAANIVAVIDTGIDATHEDLQNLRLVDGYDFIHSQPITGRVNSDDNGHGTLVAGVLGASANNGLGIVGTNWLISIMPLKALDSTGKGDSDSVAQAITWAADHGANIINLSLGGIGFGHDVTLSNAIAYAFNKGVLIVAAAGNDTATTGGNLDLNPVYPVCDDNGNNEVLGVAAVDQNGLKPEFSDYGSSCIDVVAPGKRILSTINHDPITGAYTPNSYAYASGTSLAAPFVAGEAALIRALNPAATGVQIRDQILTTAVSVDNLNLSQCGGQSCRGLLGAGEINAAAAAGKTIPQTAIADGDLVTLAPNSQIYQVVGNQKRMVSPTSCCSKNLPKSRQKLSPRSNCQPSRTALTRRRLATLW